MEDKTKVPQSNPSEGFENAAVVADTPQQAKPGKPLGDAQPVVQTSTPEPFYVDGNAVTEEEWLKLAGENGYDVERLKEMNYRPSISTKKHGEK